MGTAIGAFDTAKVMREAMAGFDTDVIASLAAQATPEPRPHAKSDELVVTPELAAAAASLVAVLLLVLYVLPTAISIAGFALEGVIKGAEFGLELVDAVYEEYPAVRGALLLLAAAGTLRRPVSRSRGPDNAARRHVPLSQNEQLAVGGTGIEPVTSACECEGGRTESRPVGAFPQVGLGFGLALF